MDEYIMSNETDEDGDDLDERNRFENRTQDKAIDILIDELNEAVEDVMLRNDLLERKSNSAYDWLREKGENSEPRDEVRKLHETRIAEIRNFCRDVPARLCTPIIQFFRNEMDVVFNSIVRTMSPSLMKEMVVSIFRQSIEDIVTMNECRRFKSTSRLPSWFSLSNFDSNRDYFV